MLKWPPNCMSTSMLHAHVHAACPRTCCMPMSMLHAHVHAAYPCSFCVQVHAGCPCPCYMFIPMLNAHAHVAPRAHGAYPCMVHVFGACPQTLALWTTNFAAFCTVNLNRAPHNTIQGDVGDGQSPKGHHDEGLQVIRTLYQDHSGSWCQFFQID
jgi:hypothetical protein